MPGVRESDIARISYARLAIVVGGALFFIIHALTYEDKYPLQELMYDHWYVRMISVVAFGSFAAGGISYAAFCRSGASIWVDDAGVIVAAYAFGRFKIRPEAISGVELRLGTILIRAGRKKFSISRPFLQEPIDLVLERIDQLRRTGA